MVDRTDKDAHTVDLTNIGGNETTTDKDEKIESEIDYYRQETRRLDREALDYRMETWGFEY